MVKNVYWSLCKVPVILFGFQWNLNFLVIFFKSTRISNFIKLYPAGPSCSMWTDGQTWWSWYLHFAILQTCLIWVRLLQSWLTLLKPLEFNELWLEKPQNITMTTASLIQNWTPEYLLSQWPTWCTNFNTFVTILYMYMFRAISCSSSGGQIA